MAEHFQQVIADPANTLDPLVDDRQRDKHRGAGCQDMLQAILRQAILLFEPFSLGHILDDADQTDDAAFLGNRIPPDPHPAHGFIRAQDAGLHVDVARGCGDSIPRGGRQTGATKIRMQNHPSPVEYPPHCRYTRRQGAQHIFD